ncbi:MAG: hypothetical protein AAF738_02055 [Bacteroidota bacterium]
MRFFKKVEPVFYALDRLGISKLYETLSNRWKPHTRLLTTQEIALARSVFGDSINYDQVRIDEQARIGTRRYNLCYVSFNTINSWGALSDELLIHELMHVWQYQHFGAVYIPRALAAQRSKEGYNYGGVEALWQAIHTKRNLWDFNYEQQGDIVADYFRLRQGLAPRWGKATWVDLQVYEYFVQQLQQY